MVMPFLHSKVSDVNGLKVTHLFLGYYIRNVQDINLLSETQYTTKLMVAEFAWECHGLYAIGFNPSVRFKIGLGLIIKWKDVSWAKYAYLAILPASSWPQIGHLGPVVACHQK